MEHVYGGEWNSLNGLCSEEAEFMAQLLGNCSIPNEMPNASSYWPNGIDDRAVYSSEETNASMYSFSQGSSSFSGGSFFPYPSPETCSHHVFPIKYNNLMDHGEDFLNQDVSNDSMESDKNISDGVLQGSKKRSRIPRDVGKNKKSMKMRKCPKIEDSNEEDDNNNDNRRSLSKYCSEDDSNGKTRASRGSATDPQSLYARKRREKINERLRILQKLVPNGTKVDISTMLEEAVQYVKFLQLQIKLLSSDDLWMYAPIAYNGMDIGALELKANIPKPESQ